MNTIFQPGLLLVAALASIACRSTEGTAPPSANRALAPAPSATPSVPVVSVTPPFAPAKAPALLANAPASAPTASARPQGSAGGNTEKPGLPPVDFDDEFAYGSTDEKPADNGPADSGALLSTSPMRYQSYRNDRFGFSLDVPVVLRAMPEPDNGDGQQWRLGKMVVLTASGSNWDAESEISESCPSSTNVTSRLVTKTSCFATGKAKGYIHWQRSVVSRGILFSLRFQYAEALKTAMDPIVKHVNDSWKR